MSSKIKWRESFQKARSQSQGSLESQGKKISLLEEGNLSLSDEELEEYLGTLKQKSGVGRLWKGNTFDKIIDRTPDVSISSVSEGEGPGSEQDKSNYSDNDFRPNILDLSHSQATEDDKSASESSSIKPMEAVHMMSDLELSEGPLVLGNNAKFTVDKEQEDLDVVSEVRSISKDLVEEEEPAHTLDEVTEEIEEDVQSKHSESAPSSTSLALSDRKLHKKPQRSAHSSKHTSQHSSHHQRHHSSKHTSQHSSHHQRHHSSKHSPRHSSSQPNSKKSSQKETYSKSDRSYTDDFSGSSQENTVQESLCDSTSYTSSVSSTKMKSQSSSKRTTKKQKKHRSYQDASTQVNPGDIATGQTSGIGVATLGPSLVHQHVDPSPIACHAVSADAVEALTAYNPAFVALTDMLRQQLRLVEQFVDNSRRMYESYTSNLNTSYNYTTLEDTMKYIQENEPFARK